MKIKAKLLSRINKTSKQDKQTAKEPFCCDCCNKLILVNQEYVYDIISFIRQASENDWWCEDEEEWSNIVYPSLVFEKLCIPCGDIEARPQANEGSLV